MSVGCSPASTNSRFRSVTTTDRSTYRSEKVESAPAASTNRIDGAPELYSEREGPDEGLARVRVVHDEREPAGVDGLDVHEALLGLVRPDVHVHLVVVDAAGDLPVRRGVCVP